MMWKSEGKKIKCKRKTVYVFSKAQYKQRVQKWNFMLIKLFFFFQRQFSFKWKKKDEKKPRLMDFDAWLDNSIAVYLPNKNLLYIRLR